MHIVLRYKQIKATLVSVITVIFPVCLFVVIFPLLVRAADRTPILVTSEGIARTAGVACCRGVGHKDALPVVSSFPNCIAPVVSIYFPQVFH